MNSVTPPPQNLEPLLRQKKVVLIGDPRVKAMPVIECGEQFEDLAVTQPSLKFDLDRRHVQKDSLSISFARKRVGEMLVTAQSYLPNGICLLVKECYRPMSVQKKFWDNYSALLRRRNPSWSEDQIYDECSKLNAPLEVAPHTTGGAVDLTLIDRNENWLDMGTEFNASPHETDGATYTKAENISDKARTNREILNVAMSRAGFINYPTEWWHWSYGDKYWALMTNKPNAIYGSVQQETEISAGGQG